jgi:hypothetical protein
MSGDSLELLLDTVCSMFGAITLIAILVGLLANTGGPNSSAKLASADMTIRKIAVAEADLKDAEALKDRLPKPDHSKMAEFITEKKRLENAVKEARIDQARAAGDLQDSASEQGTELDKEWKKLEEDWKTIQRHVTEESNAIKAQDENSERLQLRFKVLGELIEHEKERRVVKLRFPREREKIKQPYPIICKFGKVYPVHDAAMQDNTTTIKWVSDDKGKVSLPIEAEGWTTLKDEPAINGMLRDLSSADFYAVFIVYPDSFEAYHELRDRVTASNMDFGLSIEPSETRIYWGEDGKTPPPL